MADACQGEGSSPSVPSSLRKQLRKYDREFRKHQTIADRYPYATWSKKHKDRSVEIDSDRKQLRIMIKSIKRDHYRSTINVD